MIYGLMFWAMSRRRRVCFGCRVCFSNDLRGPREILVEACVALNHLEWSAPRAHRFQNKDTLMVVYRTLVGNLIPT